LLPLRAGEPAQTLVRPGHPNVNVQGRAAIGATATIYLDDGSRLWSYVDGGNGHSGKSSPELHFGLGSTSPNKQLRVEVRWRDPGGEVNHEFLALTPGWHTVVLGWKSKKGDLK
jgi:hypothetical protein